MCFSAPKQVVKRTKTKIKEYKAIDTAKYVHHKKKIFSNEVNLIAAW